MVFTFIAYANQTAILKSFISEHTFEENYESGFRHKQFKLTEKERSIILMKY